MPKYPSRTIRETPQQLANHELVYAGRPQESRLRLLRVLRTHPELSLEEAADAASVQRRSAYRWWKTYQERGLLGLVSSGLGRPTGSRKAVNSVRNTASGSVGIASAQLIALMNGLPSDLTMIEGINAFRERLLTVLPDVDRVSISLNIYCNLEDPQNYRPNLTISHHPQAAQRIDEGMVVRTGDETNAQAADLLKEMRAGGFPFDSYHEPVTFDLWYSGTAELGTIVLWREREKSTISQETINLLETLRPFLTYVFANMITRHYYANPRDRVFYSVLTEMARSARLTPQEQRIISYRLLGYSYKRIAAELDRTEGAVKKQLASVHRKTGTQGHTELFAKYFTPRLLLEE